MLCNAIDIIETLAIFQFFSRPNTSLDHLSYMFKTVI